MKYMMLINLGTDPAPTSKAFRRGAAGRSTPLEGDQPDAGRDTRPAPAAARDRDDRARAGRPDAHHRRPVRRDQGGARRLLHLRGRRPRRGDRAGGARSRRARMGGAIEVRRSRSGRRLDQVFREQWGRVLATLIGLLGDFDLAEEAAQEAFVVAAERWPRDGVPPTRARG